MRLVDFCYYRESTFLSGTTWTNNIKTTLYGIFNANWSFYPCRPCCVYVVSLLNNYIIYNLRYIQHLIKCVFKFYSFVYFTNVSEQCIVYTTLHA